MTAVDNTAIQEPFVPLVVPPRQACEMLSIGLTRLYELLHAGELEAIVMAGRGALRSRLCTPISLGKSR